MKPLDPSETDLIQTISACFTIHDSLDFETRAEWLENGVNNYGNDRSARKATVVLLKKMLAEMSDEELNAVWDSNCHDFRFSKPIGARIFLTEVMQTLEAALSRAHAGSGRAGGIKKRRR